MKHLKPLTAAILATTLSGCAGVPTNMAGVAAIVQQQYDWAAAMAARHSGGKVALPAFDAAKVLTTNLPFKFENGQITVDAGVQNAMVRMAKDGQAQLFANGSWFQIPQLPKTGYQLKAVDLKAPPPPASEQSFVLLAPGKGAAAGTVLTFKLTLGGTADRAAWKLVGSAGPDDLALVEGSGVALDGGDGNDELANLGDGYSDLYGGAGDDELIDGEGDDDVFEGEWDDENGDGVDDNTADDAPEADDEDGGAGDEADDVDGDAPATPAASPSPAASPKPVDPANDAADDDADDAA